MEDPKQETPGETPEEKPAEAPAHDLGSVGDIMQEIGQELLDQVPESEPHFVEKMQREAGLETPKDYREKEQQAPGKDSKTPELVRDRKGYIFDPAKCQTTSDGTPIYTTTGLFELRHGVKRTDLKKRLVLPKSSQQIEDDIRGENIKQSAQATAAQQAADAQMLEAQATAQVLNQLYWSMNLILAGPEIGQPAGQEYQLTAGVLTNYCMEEGGPKLPPWLPMVAVLGSVSARKVFAPENRPRRRSWKEKINYIWYRLRNRKTPEPVKNEPDESREK
jgi:hypothetical protein